MNQQLTNNIQNFEYLRKETIYLDSACQTMRPQQVIDAMAEYYQEYNSCGGRVKYDWGIKLDEKIQETRKKVLAFVGKSPSEYAVAFTLNTTYGINLVLGQLPRRFAKIITSDIEHNSVFLPTMAFAKRLNIPRVVLERSENGSLSYDKEKISNAIAVLNSMSNIDGRELVNLKEIANDLHKTGGIILIDAAQGISHNWDIISKSDFDALFFSGHKMYGPSIGVIVIKKSLLTTLDIGFIGGGMVEDVEIETYRLISDSDDLSSRLEIGLQDFAGIVGLNTCIDWLKSYKPEGVSTNTHQKNLAQFLFNELSQIPTLKLINSSPSPILSFWSDKIDAHRLAIFLSTQNIMVRSGYFCCHYYLKNLKKYPPLVRVSLGLNNTQEQVEFFVKTLKTIIINS
ncbi:aminotransferase class V-fold PLP-dependent enzyme [Candidatus Nomurabacteria bacterium]|nr:aminotransferase class V-fold PLP-dependent enzyme [Candidatus Nomurabacteria bacterium]